LMQQNPQLLSCPPRDPPRWTGPPPLARRRKRLPTNIKPIYAPRHYASLAMNGVDKVAELRLIPWAKAHLVAG